MSDITVSQEVLPRYQVDEYGTVSVQVVKKITFPDGTTTESYWRTVIDPDTTIADVKLEGMATVPKALKDAVIAARYPAAVARFEARKVASTEVPPA